jgi:hypothetical protein
MVIERQKRLKILETYRSKHTSYSIPSSVWKLIAQGCVSTASVWWTPSANGWVDTEHNCYVSLSAAFTYQSIIASDNRWGRSGWAALTPNSFVSVWWTPSVCWKPQIKHGQKGRNILGMEENEPFKGNVKWVCTVQRRAWSGIIY